ncbi:Hpt domain-containing protein [Caniella muris]|uniref:Hpt domain-containing protein n=1 Tax=Caniella muris TaxID=2941502 RepID=UPI0020402518|nr:Hpt domain-containing protein [Caniella muris]
MGGNEAVDLEGFFEAAGGDCADVLARLRSPERVARFVRLFGADPTFSTLEEAMAEGDVETAFRASHTLKGTARDVGLTAVADTSGAVCEALRAGDVDAAARLMPAARDAYGRAMAAIRDRLG